MKLNPLLDSTFLRELDSHRNRITYARITNLTTNQYPIERIEGVVTGGSITIDGDSAVRRICSLTLTTNNLNINNIYWGLTTRVKIEIGIENNLSKIYNERNQIVIDYQKQYGDIIWFPQGVFALTDFKTSASINNYTITVQGKDKMCLLNGDIGGVFNAETQIDCERVQQEDGTWKDEKKSIAYILRELVHTYAQEPFHNIIIKDIDNLSLKVLRNNATTFYLVKPVGEDVINQDIYYDDPSVTGNSNYRYYDNPSVNVKFKDMPADFVFENNVDEDDLGILAQKASWIIDENNKKYTVIKISPGEDLGYEITETYYPDELIAGVGETVTSIFDKIIDTFGDFEYFYNLDGQFVFQAKQTYVNTSWNNIVYNESEYYVDPSQVASKVVYVFDSNILTTAYQNAPQLGSIKNDYTVWGKRKTTSGIELPIHMRYAIDKKPMYYHNYNGDIFITKECYQSYIQKKYSDIEIIDNSVTIEDFVYNIVDWREIIYQMALDYYKHNHDDDFEVMIYTNNKDNVLGLSYYHYGHTGYEQYYQDIEGFWRLLYAPKTWLDEYDSDKAKTPNQIVNSEDFYNDDHEYIGPWNKTITDEPSSLLFWFDFLEADALGLGQFSVPAIGIRPKNENKDAVKALIYKDIPDVIFISEEDYEKYDKDENNKLIRIKDAYSFIIGNQFIEKNIKEDKIYLSTRGLTAQEEMDSLLYNNAYCKETITITSLPIYYLEPNTIISAKDVQRNINGYYIINKITLPLDYKGTMQITAIKVPERIFK